MLGSLSIGTMNENIEFSKVIQYYSIDVSKKTLYTYNKDYVLTDTKYELKTEYIYSGTEAPIDSGKMSSIELDFTQFANVEEVAITCG